MLDRYAEFIAATPSYVVCEALKLLFKKDSDFRCWLGQQPGQHSIPSTTGGFSIETTKTP